MNPVGDDQSLNDAMRAERAVLILHARWSMPSHLVAGIVEAWERDWLRHHARPPLPAFVVEADDEYPPAAVDWLNAQGLHDLTRTGWGEIFWLERGRVVDKLLVNQTAEALTERTLSAWGHHFDR
jgi:hypothetical protein